MKLIPHISQQFSGTIWRMEIDPVTSTLFAEVRDEAGKQVSFASVNLISGEVNFEDITADERWLTGIESAYKGVLLLHNYQSPGSPAHKGLIAIDGENGAVLWSNYNYTFNHLSKNGPICFDNRLQPNKLFLADIQSGATTRAYQPLVDEDPDTTIVLPDMINTADITGLNIPVEPFGNIAHQLHYNCYRIVSLHALKHDGLHQLLYVFVDGLQVFGDTLNTGIQKLQPEAFVLYQQHLIYLTNRNTLNVINL
jgi:hypothetical protein